MQSSQMESLHIGNMIKTELKAQGRTITWFAKAIHTNRGKVYKILNKDTKDTIDLQLLIRIFKLLHHNFVKDISNAIESEV